MARNKPFTEKEYKRVLMKAEQICAIKEQCVNDIRLKLVQWGTPAEWIETITSSLKNNNFIDEERFSRAYVKDKFRISKWGRIKIRAALKQKGIAEVYIRKGLEEINYQTYYQVLTKLLESKWKTLNGNPYEKKAKAIRFLQSRGFEYDLILKTINKIISNEPD